MICPVICSGVWCVDGCVWCRSCEWCVLSVDWSAVCVCACDRRASQQQAQLIPVSITRCFTVGTIPCEHYTVWAPYRVCTIPCGYYTVWAPYRLDTIPWEHRIIRPHTPRVPYNTLSTIPWVVDLFHHTHITSESSSSRRLHDIHGYQWRK